MLLDSKQCLPQALLEHSKTTNPEGPVTCISKAEEDTARGKALQCWRHLNERIVVAVGKSDNGALLATKAMRSH